MFSPNPGHRNLPPSPSRRNQFTPKISGGRERVSPTSSQWRKIVTYVVAAKWQHRHRVAPHLPNRTRRCRRRLTGHRRPHENAVRPPHRLVDERHRVPPPSAEDDRRDRHAARVFHLGRERRIIGHRRGEPAVGMRGLGARAQASNAAPASPCTTPGTAPSLPSHHTPPSSVRATLV